MPHEQASVQIVSDQDGPLIALLPPIKRPLDSRQRQELQHFRLRERLGLPKCLACWCGSEIAITSESESMSRAVSLFRETHADCMPDEVA